MRAPSGEYVGRLGSRPDGVRGTAVPPVRGRDHRPLWISAISVSPAGARVAEPLVARVKVRERPVPGARGPAMAGPAMAGCGGAEDRGGPGGTGGGEELTAGQGRDAATLITVHDTARLRTARPTGNTAIHAIRGCHPPV